jgi:DNA-binding winged helix-turn-helix (wHTH) protein
MQKMVTALSGDVTELLKEAGNQGNYVVVIMPGQPVTESSLRDRAELSLAVAFRQLFGLRGAENLALIAFMERGYLTKKELHDAVSYSGKPMLDSRVVDVTIHNLRRKLRPHGIAVVNIVGRGFQLTDAARNQIRQLLVGCGAEAVAAAQSSTGDAPSLPRKAKRMIA